MSVARPRASWGTASRARGDDHDGPDGPRRHLPQRREILRRVPGAPGPCDDPLDPCAHRGCVTPRALPRVPVRGPAGSSRGDGAVSAPPSRLEVQRSLVARARQLPDRREGSSATLRRARTRGQTAVESAPAARRGRTCGPHHGCGTRVSVAASGAAARACCRRRSCPRAIPLSRLPMALPTHARELLADRADLVADDRERLPRAVAEGGDCAAG